MLWRTCETVRVQAGGSHGAHNAQIVKTTLLWQSGQYLAVDLSVDSLNFLTIRNQFRKFIRHAFNLLSKNPFISGGSYNYDHCMVLRAKSFMRVYKIANELVVEISRTIWVWIWACEEGHVKVFSIGTID